MTQRTPPDNPETRPVNVVLLEALGVPTEVIDRCRKAVITLEVHKPTTIDLTLIDMDRTIDSTELVTTTKAYELVPRVEIERLQATALTEAEGDAIATMASYYPSHCYETDAMTSALRKAYDA